MASPLVVIETEEDAVAEAEGVADLDQGRVVTGEAVRRWLRSWGTAEELPVPTVGD